MENYKEDAIPPFAFFETELRKAREAEIVAQKRFDMLAVGRLSVFAGIFLTAWRWNVSGNALWGIGTIACTVAFLILMRKQQAARRERDFQRNLQTINEDELERLFFRFKRTDTGVGYQEKNHPFATDLDIFGDYSLYRLLNRTRTSEGSARLADWLKQHATPDEVLLRQQAVEEFKLRPDLRQAWEATALLHEHAAQQVGVFREWSGEKLPEKLSSFLIWRWWPFVTIILGGLHFTAILPVWPFLISLAWHLVILKRFLPTIQSLTNRTTALGFTLVAYADLLEIAEAAPYSSPWWKSRHSRISGSAVSLRYIGHWFERMDYRNNPLFALFVGIPLLWDVHCVASLEKWKTANSHLLADWLNVLSDTEAMNSLAGNAFAYPAYAVPEINDSNSVDIRCVTMGHPLISSEKRVSNDFSMGGTGHTILVTGSNMSGKSTFLRTIGLNMVLAQMGAVVCAVKFSFTPVRVFSSMRTQDSLEESTSSFYAELKRLRQLLELADEPGESPVFYLLDEILKGTNSSDRHRGAEALIRQLHAKSSAGFVSTHDLELGQWGENQDYVHNFHFRSDVENGKLNFDYKLHSGVCKSFNASELMRMMGIDIDNQEFHPTT